MLTIVPMFAHGLLHCPNPVAKRVNPLRSGEAITFAVRIALIVHRYSLFAVHSSADLWRKRRVPIVRNDVPENLPGFEKEDRHSL